MKFRERLGDFLNSVGSRLVFSAIDPDEFEWDEELDYEDYEPPNPSEPTPAVFDMATIVRNLVYDAGLEEPERLLEHYGLTPQSPDVQDMCQRDSDKRVAAIDSLADLLDVFAHSLTDVKTREIYLSLGDSISEDRKDDFIRSLHDASRVEIGSFSYAIISNLVDMGFLALTPVRIVSTSVEMMND